MKTNFDKEYNYKKRIEKEIEDYSEESMTPEHLKCMDMLLHVHKNLCKYIKEVPEYNKNLANKDIFEKINKILKTPPHTWYAYMGKPGGHLQIVKMEYNEMKEAYECMKATPPTSTWDDFMKEHYHLCAALVYAIQENTCKKEPE